MEPLCETTWDLIIAGTGLAQSLLALALSRSDKKILHSDKNKYYGGSETAFSLHEAEEWVRSVNNSGHYSFQDASISKQDDAENDEGKAKLGFQRNYSLTLAPQLIYARSDLLNILVTSKVYRQVEFQAVGSWWMFEPGAHDGTDTESSPGKLKKIPASREDVFADSSLDTKSKRSLIKFVRFIADPEAQAQAVEEHGDLSFGDYLSLHYGIPTGLQSALSALTLSPDQPSRTKTSYALPRISRHLKAFGRLSSSYNAVIPKWGGHAEIAQVSCRAGAVGGSVYMLDNDIEKIELKSGQGLSALEVTLEAEGTLSAKKIAGRASDFPSPVNASSAKKIENSTHVTRSISIVSAHLDAFFPALGEKEPVPACTVVVFPHDTLAQVPVYVIIHASESGECPKGQSVLYAHAQLADEEEGFEVLKQAVKQTLQLANKADASVLWCLQYRQEVPEPVGNAGGGSDRDTIIFQEASVDLAFDDSLVENVKDAWEQITGDTQGFMEFQDREIGAYDDDDD